LFELLALRIGWPPQVHSFIERHLQAVAATGVRVTVGTAVPGTLDRSLLPFARIVRVPHKADGRLRLVATTCLLTIRAVIGHLPAACRLLFVLSRARGGLKLFLKRWADSVPFVGLRPTLIHFEWIGSAVEYRWLPDVFGCPYIVSCRGRQINILPHLPGNERWREELRETFRSAAAVHCVSEDIRREAEGLGLPAAKARVIYTAVDTEFFSPGPLRDGSGPIRFVTVGAAIWRKGYEYMLSAFRLVLESGCRAELLIIDEDSSEADRLNYTAEDLAIAGSVFIRPRIPPSQIRDVLRSSDVFVLSSLSEGVANSLVEAMSCALPVVTTNCGGMEEAVTNGVEGFVVARRDPEALASALLRLAADKELRHRMGQAGRARALEQFAVEYQAREFLDLYRKAMNAA
jgi:colanic acid/amylovoran biosynthesis glycosyltransferase